MPSSQPSHDKATSIPFDDFEVNALGTMNLWSPLEDTAVILPLFICPPTRLAAMASNRIEMKELKTSDVITRQPLCEWDPESFSIDRCTHSLRRIQGRRRCDGSGIRKVFRDAHLLPAGRLPLPPRSSAWNCMGFELPGQMQLKENLVFDNKEKAL